MAEDIFKNTITLADAERMSGPLAFNLMIKPGGSLCNLDCRYCYYLDKSGLYGGREPRMTEDMLEKLIKNYLGSCDVPEVTFNWHGGEPLIMGLDFYRKAIEFEKKYAEDKIVHNTLQTNGTLLTPQWADFFAENNFLIGISIDGPEHIHDRYRSSKAGEPSFSRVMAGLRTLVYGGVEFNTLTAVSKASEGHGLEIYQFLKSIGSKYMQFLPVVEKIRYQKGDNGKTLKSVRPTIVNPSGESDGIGTWSISDVGYGRLLCDIFDYWVRHDVGQYFVGMFDATLAGWVGAIREPAHMPRPAEATLSWSITETCMSATTSSILSTSSATLPLTISGTSPAATGPWHSESRSATPCHCNAAAASGSVYATENARSTASTRQRTARPVSIHSVRDSRCSTGTVLPQCRR